MILVTVSRKKSRHACVCDFGDSARLRNSIIHLAACSINECTVPGALAACSIGGATVKDLSSRAQRVGANTGHE
jgi:hypothetical protein